MLKPATTMPFIGRIGRVVFGADRKVFDFAREHIGITFTPGQHSGLGVLVNGRIACAMIYGPVWRDWQGEIVTIEGNIVATDPRWASRDVLAVLFDYVFGIWKARRFQVTVQTDNARCRKLVEGLGFVEEAVIREGWLGPGGGDAVLYAMLKEECRWIPDE